MGQQTSNPPLWFPIVQQLPTRLVASGTISIGTLASELFAGSNNRQDRGAIVISNLDLAIELKLQTANGQNWGTVQPKTTVTFATSADIRIYNPDSTNSCDIEVGEFYPDTGNQNAVPQFQKPPGGPANPNGGQTGGSTGGSTSGGGSPSGG